MRLSSVAAQWVVPRLRFSAAPGRSDQRLWFILSDYLRFLYSDQLAWGRLSSGSGSIISEQSSEQANNVDVLGLHPRVRYISYSPFHDFGNIGHVRNTECDGDGETVKRRRIFRIIVVHNLLGSLPSYDLDRCIAAITGPYFFPRNGSYSTTTGGTDDYVPNTFTAMK